MKAGLRGMLRKAREARKKKVDEYKETQESKTMYLSGRKDPEKSRETEEDREPEESRVPLEKSTKRVPRFFRGKAAKNIEETHKDNTEQKTESGTVDREEEKVALIEESSQKQEKIEDCDDNQNRVDAEKEAALSPQSDVGSVKTTASNESIHSQASSPASADEDRDTRMVESIQSVDSHISTIQSPRGAGIRSMPRTPDFTPRLMEVQDTPVSHHTGFLCGCI